MPRAGEPTIVFSRLLEMAAQADRQGRCRYTPFLTPPEAELALAAGKRAGVDVTLFGGTEEAERRMARFRPLDCEPEPFPLATLEITWPHQNAPVHRDLLGAVMALGVARARTGDIVLAADRAYLFTESALAATIAPGLTEAGRVRLSVREVDAPQAAALPTGEEIRCTVQSPRLDALVADGFHLSRGNAAELIEAGAVKLRYAQTLRPDARVEEGDAISVRGYGRLRVESFGETTRKGRTPVRMTRFGPPRG